MIDSDSYMNEMRRLIESGRTVSFILSGNSMVPFLVDQRDWVSAEPLTGYVRVGDICFFQRLDGTFIMHRVCRVMGDQYYFIGDAQPVVEGPIERSQIFAIVKKVRRKGKWISAGDFWWDFFEKIWIRMIPFRIPALKLYSGITRLKR